MEWVATFSGLRKWLHLFAKFVDEQDLKSTRSYYAAFNKFYGFLITEDNAQDPLRYMTRSSRGSFYDYCLSVGMENKYNLTRINNFSNWLIANYLSEFDPESGEYTSIAFPIFSPAEILKIESQKDASLKPSETVKASMPTSWLLKCKEIITANDFEWPKSITSEYFDYKDDSGKYESVWIPTISYLYLTMLEIPLRKIQVAALDSGEGDEEVFDRASKKWVPNKSRHSNYWQKLGSRLPNRGVVRKIRSATGISTGFFINTNKTQDRETGYSETSGYTIPWHNPEIIDIFYDLRAWQEKYNPVTKPTAYGDMPTQIFGMVPSKTVLDKIPDRFYLFRSPRSFEGARPDCPPTDNQLRNYWNKLMGELEKRLLEEGHDVEIVLKRNPISGQPEQTLFTPHGLRVAGLTALAESGVPIEVLSKVVAGHASILMTLYYIKMDPGHISDQLNQAKKSIEQSQQENLLRWLKSSAWEEAKKYVTGNAEETFTDIQNKKIPTNIWINNNLGICPYGGTRCHDGGEILRRNSKKNNTYGPVPGGPKNCVRCRHLITGTPWMIPLWLHANKLLVKSQRASKEVDEITSRLEKLQSERFQIVKSKGGSAVSESLKAEIKGEETNLEEKTESLDSLLMDTHAAYRLLESVRDLPSEFPGEESGTDNTPALIATDRPEISFSEVHELRALDSTVQAGRLYTHLRDRDLERDRDHFIDQIMLNNGMNPISLSPLTPEEKSIALDAASRFLLTELNDYEIDQLTSNRVSLHELGIERKMTETIKLERFDPNQAFIGKTD
ncbi:hypothetical protein LWH94_18710 [Marinobacter sp. G11]|uniref:VPA1269 family protein n=1 Tax=Marinobacter sp. G11 TaxID=2903522 RepID=UPI001E3AD557|nr:hypothetical protein [Marinobacter sp. G11]